MTLADKGGYWGVIPGELRRDTGIPANAKLLYTDISALASERGYCYATNEYLMDLYGWSERTVQRLIQALAERGYIRVEQIEGKQRRIYCGINVVFATPDKTVTPDNFDGGGGRQKCRGTPVKTVVANKVDNDSDNDNTPPLPPKGGKREKSMPKHKPERFERFWDFYSHRVRGESRQRAVRAWDKLKPTDELIDAMGQALLRQLATEEWKRGVGIPYAATWLNDRRWEDIPPQTQGVGAAEGADDGIVRESGYLPVW